MLYGKTLLFAAALGLLLGVPTSAPAQQETNEVLAQGPQRIEMVVHGLSCPFCAYGLEKKLKKVEDLDSLSIDFKTGKVLMLVQDGSKATDERIEQLVKDAGFEVATIERMPREAIGLKQEDAAA